MTGKCAIWGTEAEADNTDVAFLHIDSPRAGGQYRIPRSDLGAPPIVDPSVRLKLTTWLVNQRAFGNRVRS